jgi:hypothetical protein
MLSLSKHAPRSCSPSFTRGRVGSRTRRAELLILCARIGFNP